MIDWTEERTRTLVHMYTRNHTLNEISAAIQVTRSAVAGKIRRMGITRETRICTVRFTPKRRTRVKQEDTAPSTACSMEELQPNQCRWPYGERETGFTFCAAETQSSVYCPKHTDIARGRKCRAEKTE